ncbi:MAG: hypothetical protein HFJ12_02825 [Bacilli bacterium]|nr:hypothetical protein [Bacilli bacterium]
MSSRLKKIMKYTVIVCLIILIIDLVIIIYAGKMMKKDKSYFDSINSFEIVDSDIISVGSNNNNDKKQEKAKITKYDREQNKIWEKLYNKGYNSSFFAVKKDKENYIAVGNYESTKDEHRDKIRSALIVKYDNNGEIIYENDFQVLGNSKFMNLLVLEDGYLVVGQSIYENMTLGLSNEGGAILIKYDKELNEVWRSNYGGSKSGIYNDLLILDDNIYTVGKDASNVGIISKYDLDGNRLTTVNYESTDSFGFTGIAEIDKHLFIVGAKKVKKDKTDYDTDALIVEYDMDCSLVREETYKGKGKERYNKVISDHDNLVISGQTGIYNKEKSTNKKAIFQYNGIFAKYSRDLKELKVVEYENEVDDYFTDIKQMDNRYVISGYSTYDEKNYLAKFIIYSKAGKLIGTGL